jgi:hypothetical protein
MGHSWDKALMVNKLIMSNDRNLEAESMRVIRDWERSGRAKIVNKGCCQWWFWWGYEEVRDTKWHNQEMEGQRPIIWMDHGWCGKIIIEEDG